MIFILTAGRPVRERHHQVSPDILDVEWSPVSAQSRKSEGMLIVIIVTAKQSETSIENFYPPGLKVGCIEPRMSIYQSDGATLVDGFTRAIFEDHSIGVHAGIPARDCAIFGHKQENGLCIGPGQKFTGGVEDGSGGSRRSSSVWGRNCDHKRTGCAGRHEGSTHGVVHGRDSRTVVGDPPGTTTTAGKTPRIQKL